MPESSAMGGIPTKRQVPERVTTTELSGALTDVFLARGKSSLRLLLLQNMCSNLKGAYTFCQNWRATPMQLSREFLY